MEKEEELKPLEKYKKWKEKRINFLEETIECLKRHGKTETDVLWVGRGFNNPWCDYTYKTTWEDFKSKADFIYDNSFGSEYIATDLIIVGEDFWLERRTYDGQEWWEYKSMPKEPTITRKMDLVDETGWGTYEDRKFQYWASEE